MYMRMYSGNIEVQYMLYHIHFYSFSISYGLMYSVNMIIKSAQTEKYLAKKSTLINES